MPRAFGHPVGLALFALSMVLAAVMWTVPALERWSGGAVWTALAGAAAYGLVVAVAIARPPPPPPLQLSPGPQGPKDGPPPPPPPPPPVREVEEALKKLNRPGDLSTCALSDRIPLTIELNMKMINQGGPAVAGPLLRAKALRQVIVVAIERLNPGIGPVQVVTPAAISYIILHDAYVQGRQHKEVMQRIRIEGGVYWNHRTDAVEVLARDLAEHEQALSRQHATAP